MPRKHCTRLCHFGLRDGSLVGANYIALVRLKSSPERQSNQSDEAMTSASMHGQDWSIHARTGLIESCITSASATLANLLPSLCQSAVASLLISVSQLYDEFDWFLVGEQPFPSTTVRHQYPTGISTLWRRLDWPTWQLGNNIVSSPH